MKGIHIFTRDYRLYDNTSFNELIKLCDKVYTIYIFTNEQVINNPFKSDKSIQFMIESLSELEEIIHNNNGKLFIYKGDYKTILNNIFKNNDINFLSINKDYTPFSKKREKDIINICNKYDISFISNYDYLLTEPNQILNSNNQSYKKFTPFYKNALNKVKKFNINNISFKNKIFNKINYIQNIDLKNEFTTLIIPDHNSKLLGGRSEGLKKLNNIKKLKDYDENKNFLNYQTSLLAAYTKYGCISIREVFNKSVMELGIQNDFVRQLFWRDFYTLILNEVNNFDITGKYASIKWINNTSHFNLWKIGNTGYPIVDANMRALNKEGWMHNRGRLIVASFLIKTLGIDWKKGEKYFATKLIDYDVAVNNGNWQWVSGTGTDSQPYFRIFNPWTQSAKYDPQAEFIKKWIPELQDLQPQIIHNWYKYCNDDNYKNIVKSYNKPIVDYYTQKEKIIKIYKDIF